MERDLWKSVKGPVSLFSFGYLESLGTISPWDWIYSDGFYFPHIKQLTIV